MTERQLIDLAAKLPGWDNPNRQAVLARLRYRRNPDLRLAAINRDRRKRGLPEHTSLADSVALRLPA